MTWLPTDRNEGKEWLLLVSKEEIAYRPSLASIVLNVIQGPYYIIMFPYLVTLRLWKRLLILGMTELLKLHTKNGLESIWSQTDIWAQCLFILSFVSATILGAYAREGIAALATYTPSYVKSGSIIWSNLVSCILMGMLQELNSAQWFALEDLKWFFIVLSVGFCGTHSSYSRLFLEIFEQSTSLSPSNIKDHSKLPNRAFGMKEFLAVLLSQLFISVGGYLFGRGFAESIIVPLMSNVVVKEDEDRKESKQVSYETKEFIPKPWVYKMLRFAHWLFALFAIPMMVVLIVLASVRDNYSRGKWTLFALFGLFGSYIRYQVSKFCNPLIKNFPIGTFICNQWAVILIACLQIVLRGKKDFHQRTPVAHTVNSCYVTNALINGFCEALSTISTFINEGYNLPFNRMLIYYLVSIFISYSLMVIILGSYSWTRGLTEPAC